MTGCGVFAGSAATGKSPPSIAILFAAAFLAGGAFVVAVPSHASECGNGVVEPSEECDPGGRLYFDGDPAGDPCTSDGNCFFEFSCCKFNCQHVGQGATCNDDNPCTRNDQCNNVGMCRGNDMAEGAICEDGDPCTIGDRCLSDVCTGNEPLMVDLCPWTLASSAAIGNDRLTTGFSAIIEGDVCAQSLTLGEASTYRGDAVAMRDTGRTAIRVGVNARIDGNVASGGGGATGMPGDTRLPHVDAYSLAPGTLTPKDDGSGVYDLTGDHPLVEQCSMARASFGYVASELDLMPADASHDRLMLHPRETVQITAPVPGAINVIDIEDVFGANESVLRLDGGGDGDTAVVLRISGRFMMRAQSRVELAGGLEPEDVLIYVAGRVCDIGDKAAGAGTLLCTRGRIRAGLQVEWAGAIWGNGKMLRVGDHFEIDYRPFQGF
ncbi:MAG TPA: hypothetical protein VEC57_08665 [Candidatus Limnocylindrales bacterium]|nr:hypothetical protein [Candidatus Limnocylindrales bacterium]